MQITKKISSINRRDNSGFTLAELLIVVAIIGILVGIAIPVFTSQLEKSREATDIANVRAAYAQIATESLSGEKVNSVTVSLKQKKDDFQTEDISIGGITKSDKNRWIGTPRALGTARVYYDSRYGVVINWNGAAVISSVDTKPGYWDSTKGNYVSEGSSVTSSIATYNTERSDKFYVIERGKTYSISCTYSLKGDKGQNNYGLLASAVLLFDENKKSIMDTGRTRLTFEKTTLNNNGTECGFYQYKDNGDGTYTFTAAFKVPDKESDSDADKCYLAMNFFGRDLTKQNAGGVRLSGFMSEQRIKEVQNQIKNNFTVEEKN